MLNNHNGRGDGVVPPAGPSLGPTDPLHQGEAKHCSRLLSPGTEGCRAGACKRPTTSEPYHFFSRKFPTASVRLQMVAEAPGESQHFPTPENAGRNGREREKGTFIIFKVDTCIQEAQDNSEGYQNIFFFCEE